MSRKQTITFPDELHAQIVEEARACSFSLNRYVIRRLSEKKSVVFVNLQDLTKVLVRLQQILLAETLDKVVKEEVRSLCRYCMCSLVQMTKKSG